MIKVNAHDNFKSIWKTVTEEKMECPKIQGYMVTCWQNFKISFVFSNLLKILNFRKKKVSM
jgi:hypothetical protein